MSLLQCFLSLFKGGGAEVPASGGHRRGTSPPLLAHPCHAPRGMVVCWGGHGVGLVEIPRHVLVFERPMPWLFRSLPPHHAPPPHHEKCSTFSKSQNKHTSTTFSCLWAAHGRAMTAPMCCLAAIPPIFSKSFSTTTFHFSKQFLLPNIKIDMILNVESIICGLSLVFFSYVSPCHSCNVF